MTRLAYRYCVTAFMVSWTLLGTGIGAAIYRDNDTWGDRLLIGGFCGLIYAALSAFIIAGLPDAWRALDNDDKDS